MPRQKTDKRASALRDLIHARLAARTSIATARGLEVSHLDEDQLTAFVEGRLGEAESAPLITHIVSCAACRRVTAELVRLQLALGREGETELTIEQEEPGRIRRLLEELASRVVHTHEEVMAYHAPAEDLEEEKREEEDKNESSDEEQDGSRKDEG